MLELGWDVTQTFSTETVGGAAEKYWNIRLKPYAEASIYIINTVDLTKAYFNEITLDLDQFLANVFGELRLYSSFDFCYGAGYQTDSITFRLELA